VNHHSTSLINLECGLLTDQNTVVCISGVQSGTLYTAGSI